MWYLFQGKRKQVVKTPDLDLLNPRVIFSIFAQSFVTKCFASRPSQPSQSSYVSLKLWELWELLWLLLNTANAKKLRYDYIKIQKLFIHLQTHQNSAHFPPILKTIPLRANLFLRWQEIIILPYIHNIK